MMTSFFEALESLGSNKLRSGLTALGIVIGVAAVIAMLAVGGGAQNSITSEIESIGTTLLYVMPQNNVKNAQAITVDDAAAIQRQASAVQAVAPVLQGQVTASYQGESTSVSMVATTPEYANVQNLNLTEGIWLTEAHLNERAAVVILGPEAAETLFGRTTNLMGQKIRLNNQSFRVLGVLEVQGGTGFGSSDNQVIVPLTTAQARLSRRGAAGEVDLLYVQAATAEQVDAAESQVSAILRQRHQRESGDEDFRILSTQTLLDTASSITGVLTMFLGGIAGISLLVGGIGIMNIMLVSVVERTREIGLRKALGARKGHILLQFLVESSMLSIGGGVIGILFGWGIAALVGKIATLSGTELSPAIDLNAILLAVLFSTAIGLFFGIYPANRAANLEPVEALRSE